MKKFYPVIFLLFCCRLSFAQLVINEVCPVNGNVILDEDNDPSDWIELYNTGTTPFNLHDYILSDRNDELKFHLPAVTLPPGGYFLVYASGKNRLTTPVHTNFKISQGETIYLFDPNGNLIDQLETGIVHLDHSKGRYPDGGLTFQFHQNPTPGNANTSGFIAYTSNPEFSVTNNFLPGVTAISILYEPGAETHFTLNGSVPDSTSPVYSTPINVSDHTVIRCIAYVPGKLASEVVSRTYFVNFNTTLPIISISTDAANLWDWNTGILVHGPNCDSVYPYLNANFWQDWSIPVHVEFYDKNKMMGFEQDMSAKVHGGQQNRAQPMKSLRLIAKKKYGKGRIDYPLIQHKPINSYKKFVLRNGSSDFLKSHFRDEMIHFLLYEKTHNDILGYEPAIVFLNGEYYGLENIREKRGRYYLNENYGYNTDEVDILREENIVLEGDSLAFVDLYQTAMMNDLAIDSNFIKVSQKLDILNLADYFITQTFFDNNDWPYNNLEYWRPRINGGKFRYLLFDLDVSLGCLPWSPYHMDMLGKILGPYGDNCMHVQILKKTLQNKTYYNYFVNRYCDLLNTIFTTDDLKQQIEKSKNKIENEIPRHFARWNFWDGEWEMNIENLMMPYVEQRPLYARNQLQDTLHPGEQVNLKLDVFPPDAGTIQLNTIQPDAYPWSGIYFTKVPVQLKAEAKTGNIFQGWKIEQDSVIYQAGDSLVMKLQAEGKITAYYSSIDEHHFFITPNPAQSQVNIVAYLPSSGHIKYSVNDASGRNIINRNFDLKENILSVQEDVSQMPTGFYIVHLMHENFSISEKLVISR